MTEPTYEYEAIAYLDFEPCDEKSARIAELTEQRSALLMVLVVAGIVLIGLGGKLLWVTGKL